MKDLSSFSLEDLKKEYDNTVTNTKGLELSMLETEDMRHYRKQILQYEHLCAKLARINYYLNKKITGEE